MKKYAHLALFASITFATASEMPAAQNGFYFVTKALITTPETVTHNGATLESNTGTGIGVDVGYKLPHHLAVELDVSYDHNTVTEAHEAASANYLTYALDLAYTMHLTHALGVVGKIGYEIEDEQIEALHVSAHESGVVYALGVEYALNKHYEIIAEYEHSSIESTRGSSIFTGVKYTF